MSRPFGSRKAIPDGAVFSPDGRRVLIWSGDRQAHIWDIATRKEVVTMRGHTGALTTAAYSADGSLVVTGGTDNTVRVWNAETGRGVAIDRSHTGYVTAVAFDPRDKTQILSSSNDQTATVFRCVSCNDMEEVEALVRRRTAERSLTDAEIDEFLG
jgi:WD40 repeat protein